MRDLLDRTHAELSRSHPYAYERVAFLTCRPASARDGALMLFAETLHSVADEDYEHDHTVGAMLGPEAFRRMLKIAYNRPVSVLHVHRHEHSGRPWFSDIDRREAEKYVPDFWKVRPHFPHGTLVLSHDSAAGLVWLAETRRAERLSRISVIGTPLQEIRV